MDLTGSILKETLPLSAELTSGSDGTGSSAIDTLSAALVIGPNLLLNFIGDFFGDLGSSGSLTMVGDIFQGGLA